MNKATQESAEGPVRGPSATETARDASVHRDLDRVVCARHLIHDWQSSYGELGRSQNVYGFTSGALVSIRSWPVRANSICR